MTIHPIDAFAWLLDQFRGYSRLELTWLEARHVLERATTLCNQYQDWHRDDAIALFTLAMRAKEHERPALVDCTDDYLWQTLQKAAAQGDSATVGYISMLLWSRQETA
jgi:hypothetical protein